MIHAYDWLVVLAMALVTFFTRALPFVFFRKRTAPPLIRFLQTYIPPMMMLILVVYSVKDIEWLNVGGALPAGAGIAVTAGLHLAFKNALVSIFGGTAAYMLLIQVV